MNMSRKFYSYIFTLLVAGPMSLVMTLAITIRNNGFNASFFPFWMRAFGFGFCIAYPTALIVVPIARKIIEKIKWVN